MTEENVTIKFEKVTAETVAETENLVSFDFVIDILADYITDYFDTTEEFYENFKLVFTNSVSSEIFMGMKSRRDEKMPKFTLMSDERGNFYRTHLRYEYTLATNVKSYKLGYHYELSLASLRQKYGYSLTEPADVVSVGSQQVSIVEAGEFLPMVQDMTGLQTFGELAKFVAPPKLTEVLQLDKILYKTAKSDGWYSEVMSTKSENNYVFHVLVDAEKFMAENYRLNSLILDKLSATDKILNVYATAVSSGMVLSVVKTELGSNKLLVTIKASAAAVKITFAFKDNSKERAQKIVDAIAVGPEAAFEIEDLSKFVDGNKVFELLKEPKYYEKIKESLEKFSYQIFLMFPELTAPSQGQTLYTADPGFRVVEIHTKHQEASNNVSFLMQNHEYQSFEEFKERAAENTKAIFGEQKSFYLAESTFTHVTSQTELSYLNLPLTLKDSVKGAKSYENPLELFYDLVTGKELSIENSINLLAAENSVGLFQEVIPLFTLQPNIFDAFLGTPKIKEANSAAIIDELPLSGLENYFAELFNVDLTGDSEWLYPPKKYFTDKPLTEGLFLPNSIKYLISRNVLKNDFGRFDDIFFESASNNLKKFLYPIFFLKYLLVFEVEFYNVNKGKWETLTVTSFQENNVFCRLRRYENKKYIPEELFKKFRKAIEINNKYFILRKEA